MKTPPSKDRPPAVIPPTWKPGSTRTTWAPASAAATAAHTPADVAPYTTTSAATAVLLPRPGHQREIVRGQLLAGAVDAVDVVQGRDPELGLRLDVGPPLGPVGHRPLICVDQVLRQYRSDNGVPEGELSGGRNLVQDVVEPDHVADVTESGVRRVGHHEGVRLGGLRGPVE